MKSNAWSLVLAGGDGNRLRGLSVDDVGHHRPKQFHAFGEGPSLLRRTVERAAAVTSQERILAAVTESQRRWWERELADVPEANIVAQPSNRGTAPAVLLSLLRILERDPDARVVILPSDHFVESEDRLRRAIERALECADDRVILLGAAPDRADAQLGWIRPLAAADSSLMLVDTFVEKPDLETASALMRQGAMVNTLIVAASGPALLDLYRRTTPALVEALERDAGPAAHPPADRLADAYEAIPTLDFSARVLEPGARQDALWVMQLPACGWSDLGTPERLAAVRRRRRGASWILALEQEPRRFPPDYWLG